ncbi:MAG: hypothetical protein MUE60_15440, partial [Candidatus Eisenbacteria bacterium]|nr:hypothetical protein [Candidatus Eisenbacteria bacterium]
MGWPVRPCAMLAILFLFSADASFAAPGIQRVMRLGPPLPREVALTDSFVVWSSLTVTVADSGLRAGDDYRTDPFRGRLSFMPSLADSVAIVRYRFLPLGIPSHMRRRVPPLPGEMAPVALPAEAVSGYPADLSSEGEIRVAGTKTIGVRFGSGRDPSLDQALQVQLAGTLAGDIEVSASLSDESTQIQPEGTTQELRDLDRVVIELRRRDSRLSVGDCSIATEGFRFLGIERKMQGVAGVFSGGGWRGSGAAASTRGTYVSVEFVGAEGTQGPYSLGRMLPAASGDVTVLAGTERVYLDGELAVRGSDKDYTIDYTTGEITFTSRRVISSVSRVVVDFQYTSENYRRSIYTVAGAREMFDGVTVRLGLFREVDDPSSPLDWSLTDGDREALRAAGDDPGRAVVPSWRFVGTAAGTYDTLHVSFLIPSEGGGWTAEFDSVGPGSGSYRRAGLRYEYYGPNGGIFTARAESGGGGPYARRTDIILVPGGSRREARHEAGIHMGWSGDPAGEGGSFEATFYRAVGGDYVRRDASTWSYVGPGHGEYVVSRALPAPRSHGTAVLGLLIGGEGLQFDGEAAVAVRDANTFSPLDDGDNTRGAAEAHLAIRREGGVLPWWQGQAVWRSQGAGFVSPGRARPVDWERDWSGTGGGGSEDEGTVDMAVGLPGNGRLGLVFGHLRSGAVRSRRAQATASIVGPGGYS